MITLSTAQLDAWIAALIYPLARILAFISMAPLWNSQGVSRRARLMLGLALTFGLAPVLPAIPNIPPGSGAGLWLLAQQMLIGTAMGFVARAIFAAVDVAGNYISLQMGLGFATMYDPLNTAQTPVLSSFLGILMLLVFLGMNGHLMYLGVLARSFELIPIAPHALAADSWWNLSVLGGKLFGLGLLMALPVLIALIITNLALAVLTRAAPQLNVFSIGFPITLGTGMAALLIGMQYLAVPLESMFNTAAEAMLGFAVPAR